MKIGASAPLEVQVSGSCPCVPLRRRVPSGCEARLTLVSLGHDLSPDPTDHGCRLFSSLGDRLTWEAMVGLMWAQSLV